MSPGSSAGCRLYLGVALAAIAVLVLAAPAHAKSLLSTTVTASKAAERTCYGSILSAGSGHVSRSVRAPSLGVVQVRLRAAAGDWDLGVFDAKSGRAVAGSTHFGSTELAESYVTKGQRLVVQACRVSGPARRAQFDVGFEAIKADKAAGKLQLVRIYTPTESARTKLAALGLDLTEHGTAGFMDVVLHGKAEARKVRQAGLTYAVRVGDLAAQSRADRSADAAFASAVSASALPSGRTTYRRLPDYTNEMKQLAQANPDLVTTITLPFRTWEGRPVEGIEITTNPKARDGKPVFLQMGLHHAREWPSGEHALEWAYELVNGYRAGNARVRRLVSTTRTIVIPVVNPDGFNLSREAGELQGGGGGRGGSDETANIVSHPNEYRRKNCRLADDSPAGSCAQPSVGLAEPGVDPNRNYGGFWGGPGADSNPLTQTYRGPDDRGPDPAAEDAYGPFSEPETRNVRWLVSRRHVTALITNHTFSNLVLRPPGISSLGASPDETIYKALGDAMAAENGYSSQFGWQLYDTTGTTEDWSYWSTGGLGFTFEIGPTNFHPPFVETVAEYEGTTQAAGAGLGNREAYFKAQEATADATKHSVIAGRAPGAAVLRLKKTFQTPTSQRNPDGSLKTFTDTLNTTTVVPAAMKFEWHVNPSTRPLVAQARGRAAEGDPSPPQTFQTNGTTVPCAEFENPPPSCYEDHLITVPGGAGIDNAKAIIRIEWPTIASDWDMKVYRADANGQAGQFVDDSAQGLTDFEQVVLNEPDAGDYVVRVINFAAAEPWSGEVTFEGPEPFQPAQTESWTLTCESPEGTVRSTQQITIGRGQRQTLDLRKACKR